MCACSTVLRVMSFHGPVCALAWMVLGAAVVPGCAPEAENAASGSQRFEGGRLRVTSTAFAEGGTIPRVHTGDGADLSPPLAWEGAPESAQSFAVICDDPDAPLKTWVHWVLYNIPGDVHSIKDAVPPEPELSNGARQGVNDFGNVGYGGPAPPPGPPHRYYFKVYAVDSPLGLPALATKADLLDAIQGHILGQGELIGLYRR